MIKREMVEYTDMEMYASWRKGRYVCRSNKFILCCVNDQWGLTKPTQEQIREMYSGLNLNQDKATKPQTVQIVRQGEATPYWFKFNPLYLSTR